VDRATGVYLVFMFYTSVTRGFMVREGNSPDKDMSGRYPRGPRGAVPSWIRVVGLVCQCNLTEVGRVTEEVEEQRT